MAVTVRELAEAIANQLDECSICDLLQINSFELVAVFEDRIEDMYDKLVAEFAPGLGDDGMDSETN